MAKKPASERFRVYPWVPSEAMQDALYAAFTLAELGLFHHLLNISWVDNGLPPDVDDLRARARDGDAFDRAWQRVAAAFPIAADGRRRNPRQELERDTIQKAIDRSVAQGRAGAQKRWAQRRARDEAREKKLPPPPPTPPVVAEKKPAEIIVQQPSLPDIPVQTAVTPSDASKMPWLKLWQDTWATIFQAATGNKYGWVGGKDTKHMRALHQLAGGDVETFADASVRLMQDPFWADRGVDLGVLHSQWNRMRSSGRIIDRNITALMQASAGADVWRKRLFPNREAAPQQIEGTA